MPYTIGKCKKFWIKHTTVLEGETFLRKKHKIAFFEIKCTFFGRKENTISHGFYLMTSTCALKTQFLWFFFILIVVIVSPTFTPRFIVLPSTYMSSAVCCLLAVNITYYYAYYFTITQVFLSETHLPSTGTVFGNSFYSLCGLHIALK